MCLHSFLAESMVRVSTLQKTDSAQNHCMNDHKAGVCKNCSSYCSEMLYSWEQNSHEAEVNKFSIDFCVL